MSPPRGTLPDTTRRREPSASTLCHAITDWVRLTTLQQSTAREGTPRHPSASPPCCVCARSVFEWDASPPVGHPLSTSYREVVVKLCGFVESHLHADRKCRHIVYDESLGPQWTQGTSWMTRVLERHGCLELLNQARHHGVERLCFAQAWDDEHWWF